MESIEKWRCLHQYNKGGNQQLCYKSLNKLTWDRYADIFKNK